MTHGTKAVLVIGGGVLILSWFKRPPVTSVTTSEGFDLSVYGGESSYPQPLKLFAQAIAKQEGFYKPGSIPQRAHNPGDLKIPGRPTLPGTFITLFESDDQGWDALYRQLMLIVTGASEHYNLDMTIDDMARVWTATQQKEWGKNVASYLGASVTDPLYRVLV